MVSKAQMEALPKIVAVDFDGTIVQDRYPMIGEVNEDMLYTLRQLQDSGVELILWTSRDGEYLQRAVEFCESLGLRFAAVNKNHPACIALFNNDTRKVYADLYIDDKAIPHIMSPSFWAERLGLRFTLGRGIYDGT